MAGTTGLEPAASAVTGQRSNQLNYVPAKAGFTRPVDTLTEEKHPAAGLPLVSLLLKHFTNYISLYFSTRYQSEKVRRNDTTKRMVGSAGLEPAAFSV